MKDEVEKDLSNWLSTYGLITAERILGKYEIYLSPEELREALSNPYSFYHRLLILPLKNVMNGIILSQAFDYQVYAQKVFIDYLMSGESSKSEESPGALTRENIENERKKLVTMGDEFHECELENGKLIAASQKKLMKLAKEWEKLLGESVQRIATSPSMAGVAKNLIARTIRSLVIEPLIDKSINIKKEVWLEIEKKLGQSLSSEARQIFTDEIAKLLANSPNLEVSLTDFNNQIDEMSLKIRQWRADFYRFILNVNELLQLLPEYHANKSHVEEHQESLLFDAKIGENSSE